MHFTDLKNNLKKDFSGLKTIKIAILADTATQLFTQAIKGYGYEVGINFNIFEADYNQIEKQVFDTSSQLYQCRVEFIIIFHSIQKLMNKFFVLNNQDKKVFSEKHIEKTRNIYTAITANDDHKMIYLNFPEINDSIFGNYSNKVEASFLHQVRQINVQLASLSRELNNLFIDDVSALQSQYGYDFIFDPRMYVTADMPFSMDFLPMVAKNTVDIIQAISGNFKKCLILDLDNTCWGGIIGEDGIENIQIGDLGIGKAFTDFQLWIKQLKERGIILAICSKNNEDIAKEPFLKHPDMVLRLEDIAVFVANHNNKVDNIKYIQSVLNIDFDSMVFVDDDHFERSIIKSNIPKITVPQLPDDPALYLDFLRKLNLFETVSYTEEDALRTQHYQEETKRNSTHKTFLNEDDFLASLQMSCAVRPFDAFNIPRISQLTQRSNQFNLRTIRYTDEEIKKICDSDDFFTLSFNLKDKFGDYGLISVVILKKQKESLFIDTWIMSCRVLKRGLEQFTLNQIVHLAKKNNFIRLIGEYIPTSKNGLVKDHYAHLGFVYGDGHWTIDLDEYKPRLCLINAENGG
jgi:FkbH-like protein